MPWSVGKDGRCPLSKPWAVVKDTDGQLVACHETQEEARNHQKALYSNVEE